jgi:hypothetical protein
MASCSRSAIAVNATRSAAPERLGVYETLLQRLPQDLDDMAVALGQFIQEEHAMEGQRHIARLRHVAAGDQPDIGDGMMRRATRSGRDQRRAVAGEARDTVEARGLRASVSGITGRMVNRRRASFNCPAPGRPKSQRLCSQPLHPVPLDARDICSVLVTMLLDGRDARVPST